MDEIIKKILTYGLLPTAFLVFLFLIIQDPNRAFKLKSLIISPFFSLFKWFKKSYIANKVAGNLNTFFKKEFIGSNKHDYNFQIKWVKDNDDPILKEDLIIIRIRKDEDQTKNILTAAQFSLPKIVLPLLRPNISKTCSAAIDMTFLQKIADQLGRHGKMVFKQHFLTPSYENDPQLILLLQKLLKLDQHGIFIPIFINELEKVSEGLYADSDFTDRTTEIIDFLEYLITIAEREIGSEIELCFFSNVFKVGTILLAKAPVAAKRGLIPYLRRLSININKGCDSIYFIAFPPAMAFLDKLVKAVDGNQKVNIENTFVIRERRVMHNQNKLKIVCLYRNKIFSSDLFKDKIDANNIKIGVTVEGTVFDCSINEALISVQGMDGVIRKSESSWTSYQNCNDVLAVGEKRKFFVKNIDFEHNHILLSLKFPEEDPWLNVGIPNEGDVIKVFSIQEVGLNLICASNEILEVIIPLDELSWYILNKEERKEFLKKELEVKVTSVNKNARKIVCSLRALDVDPWPEIHKSLKPGTSFNGRICEINEHFVRVKIEGGLSGNLPKESLVKAGYEYANYKENLIIGQGLEVVISKVFIAKRKIRLELKRNYESEMGQSNRKL